MPPVGPSLSDLRRKGIPRTLRVSLQGSQSQETEDPIEKARELRRELIGDRILETTVKEAEVQADVREASIETAKAEAELKRMEALSRLEEARAKHTGRDGQTPIVDAMLAMLHENNQATREALAEVQKQLSETRDSQWTGMLQDLRSEIADLKRQQIEVSSGSREPDTTSAVLGRIEDIIKLREALSPLSTASPEIAAASGDIGQVIMLKRLEQDHAFRLEQLRDERERTEFSRRLELKRLDMDERRTTEMGRMFDQLAPVLGMFARQRLGMPVESPPGSPATGPITVQSQPCQTEGCKGIVSFVTGQNMAPCTQCGIIYQLSHE